MTPVCKVEFSGLTPAQHIRLVQAYAQIIGEAGHEPEVVDPTPFVPNVPARAPVAQTTADPFASHPQPVVQPPAPQTQAPANGNGQVAPGAVKDAFGVPYNPAIHSITTGPTAGRNQDGSWKMKKNVSREEYNAWNLRHRAAANAPAPSPEQLNTQFGAPPVVQPPVVQNGDPFTAQPGVAFGSQLTAQPPAPAVDYATFVAKCNDLAVKGLMGDETVKRVKREVNCDDEKLINNDAATRARAYQVLLKIEQEALVDA